MSRPVKNGSEERLRFVAEPVINGFRFGNVNFVSDQGFALNNPFCDQTTELYQV